MLFKSASVLVALLAHVPPSIEFRHAPMAVRAPRWIALGGGVPAAAQVCPSTLSPRRLQSAPLFALGNNDNGEEEAEDLTHLTAEYRRLAADGDGVAFSAFLRSEEVQAILADDSTFLQDIAEIWMKYAGSDSAPVGLESFIAINREIDDLFEFVDDDEEGAAYGEAGDDEDGDVLRGEASMLMQVRAVFGPPGSASTPLYRLTIQAHQTPLSACR